MLLFCTLHASSLLASDSFDLSGHTKYRLHHTTYPSDSLYRYTIDEQATDHSADLRLKLAWKKSNFNARGGGGPEAGRQAPNFRPTALP